ncbi:bifunctional epoxide hydrolase 2-like protein [Carex littledalei]|uniref:Bifunctional epoxide hydrolase 2-like protein n=1 Tax=Carex littledalei TaxID=544730 RepID=A0A833VHI3_9POAL|nr:bifunctional epoxide hydrolase 2-like protein [Carex littledalei]
MYHFPGAKEYIHKGGFKKDVPLLQDIVVIQGAGHFINQEKALEISEHIHQFISKI